MPSMKKILLSQLKCLTIYSERNQLIYGKTLKQHLKDKDFVYRIYCKFHGQKAICNNPNAEKYKHYGAKGILVEYTFLELLSWVKQNLPHYSEGIEQLSIGRKNHEGNYCLENLKLETISSNSKERNKRRGPAIPPVPTIICDAKTGFP